MSETFYPNDLKFNRQLIYWRMEKPTKTQPARVIRVQLLIERIRYGILY